MKPILLIAAALLWGCFEGPAGPKGDKGDKGDTGEQGPAGENLNSAHVLSGVLSAAAKSPLGDFWSITNPYASTATLASVYVRVSSAYTWWMPEYFIEQNGSIRIFNNSVKNGVLTDFEYRIVVAELD